MEGSQRRLVMMAGDGESGESCRTFVFKGENHTLGNALRTVILQNPEVIFCGYSMPHPAEDQMLLRIQTVNSSPAQEALKKGLEDLKDMCHNVSSKFSAAISKHQES